MLNWVYSVAVLKFQNIPFLCLLSTRTVLKRQVGDCLLNKGVSLDHCMWFLLVSKLEYTEADCYSKPLTYFEKLYNVAEAS